jgi:ABC-type phosphate transport system permease subunit
VSINLAQSKRYSAAGIPAESSSQPPIVSYPTQPIASLTVQLYSYAISPFADWQRQAWAGTLVLTVSRLRLKSAFDG